MGNGIAHVFAQSGFNVQLFDISEDALQRADAYWALAKDGGPDAQAAAKDFATGDPKVEAEALEMIQRFNDLFPEHARG